jgi:CelD/BcsL family acetyltransferase involved in cellulose biosynthesis
MTVSLLIGSEAKSLLKSQVFQQQWNALYTTCPWATPCQSVGFATTWYEVYRERFNPILAIEMTPERTLTGLLTLAISPDSNQLVFAGTPQSDYHTWIATIDRGDAFIEAAMDLLSVRFPRLTLKFEYLPPLAPRQWLKDGRPWAQTSILAPFSRPLMILGDGAHLQKSLRKSSNKSRLNRLKRLGEVRFEQLHTEAELAAVFDDIIAYLDFRQGAVHNALPFQNDPLKREFWLALMRVKDLPHVTVLKVEDRVVAAHIGLIDRRQCILAMPVHSPFDAIHSPGKLHLLMLGLELAKQGLEVFDLTPGGDPYKERFATDHDRVHILTVFLSRQPWQKQMILLKRRVISLIKWLGVDLKTAKASIEKIRSLPVSTFTKLPQSLGQKQGKIEYWIYRHSPKRVISADRSSFASRDYIPDLLVFQPTNPLQTRQDFLSLCLKRIEAGQHVYTRANSNGLIEYAWLLKLHETSFFPESEQEYEFEPDSAVIYDYYLHPTNQTGYSLPLLQQMIDDAVSIDRAKQVYMSISANYPLQQVIKAADFICLDSQTMAIVKKM